MQNYMTVLYRTKTWSQQRPRCGTNRRRTKDLAERRAGERKEEEEQEGQRWKPASRPRWAERSNRNPRWYSDSFIRQLDSHHALIILLSWVAIRGANLLESLLRSERVQPREKISRTFLYSNVLFVERVFKIIIIRNAKSLEQDENAIIKQIKSSKF